MTMIETADTFLLTFLIIRFIARKTTIIPLRLIGADTVAVALT
jgi:hypothetical protein